MSSVDKESQKIPSPSTSFDAYQASLQSAAVAATKSSMSIPKDLSYHRSLDRKFGKRLDVCSDRILAITSHLLRYAEAGNEAEGASSSTIGKGNGKRRLESEEDVVDGFHSFVVDVMDQLLERTDTCLDEFLGRTKPAAISINLPAQAQNRNKIIKAPRGQLDPFLKHASQLPKPQLLFRSPVDNKNTTISWRPRLKVKYHAVAALDKSCEDSTSSMHPYQYEITHLTPPAHLLSPPSSPSPPEPLASSPPVTYISHASQLPVLLEALKQASEIAVDLEHHSYRSFAGFVCLMQLSTRTQDWIVDCLDPEIREELECLNEVLANPNIVKVFHGAESDIVWLQQDFNLYVVNLFDTYHATKVLDFPRHSLAALLEMFCDFTPDKRYQLADWRIRPLPTEMLLYARSDTHFLLYIYDNLRKALLAPRSPQPQSQLQVPLLDVFKRSADTALRTYVREVYDELGGSGAGGWDTLSRKWNRWVGAEADVKSTVFRAVHAWRDSVARDEDESTRYVLPNHYIFQLAEKPPTDLPTLLAKFQPVPPLVRTGSLELLDVIKQALQRATTRQPPIEPQPVAMTKVDDEVRVVGSSNEAAKVDLWDRLKPVSTHIATSSSFGTTLPVLVPSIAYSTSTSLLLGPMSREPGSSTTARYNDIVARIHSTLVLAPSFPNLTAVRATMSVPVSVTTPGPNAVGSNPAAQAEISYVPPTQRQVVSPLDPSANDSIVIVGQRQKKRKRKADIEEETVDSPTPSDSSRMKKRKDQAAPREEVEALEPFNFASAPNILDEPASVLAPAKKRRAKGAKADVQKGSFGAPPRNMSEVKSGNQSRTFR